MGQVGLCAVEPAEMMLGAVRPWDSTVPCGAPAGRGESFGHAVPGLFYCGHGDGVWAWVTWPAGSGSDADSHGGAVSE